MGEGEPQIARMEAGGGRGTTDGSDGGGMGGCSAAWGGVFGEGGVGVVVLVDGDAGGAVGGGLRRYRAEAG